MTWGKRPAELTEELLGRIRRLDRDLATIIGFPGASDFDYTPLAPFLAALMNNAGDPYVSGVHGAHTKDLEVEVVEFFADLFGAPPDDRWGYVTSGGSEATLYALRLARWIMPGGVLYHSDAAHDSVTKAADLLGMPAVGVRTEASGELDYEDLHRLLQRRRDVPPVIVANIGTTMTEAVDDVPTIREVLQDLAIFEHFIHADAALAGVPLAVSDESCGFGLGDGGAHTVCISGHKFLGSPIPYGVLLTRRTLRELGGQLGSYTGSPDATITGSRSSLAPLFLWYRLHELGGARGLHERAERCRELAEYAHHRLVDIGWEAWRNPRSFTVVLKTPPAAVLAQWTLVTHDGWSHLICMPGVTRQQIDRFVTAVRTSMNNPTGDGRSVIN
jgi:histidine decarboxylase